MLKCLTFKNRNQKISLNCCRILFNRGILVAMDADISLEEGEIIDDYEDIQDCENNYTPLERPSNYSSTLLQPRFPTAQVLESEEEVESSSDSDSDSDVKSKRPKLKLKPQLAGVKNGSHKKYDIWSTHVQEDVLLENLVNCDVSRVDRSRNVESYPVPYLNKLPVYTNKNNKRTRADRNKSNLRLCKTAALESEINDVTGVSRTILDVHVTVEDSEDDIAKDIANKLYEEKEDLIRTIVTTAGKEKALQLFKETKRIEEGGGMLIMNQTRRRTPGGVYLFLVKHDSDLTKEQHNEIFQEERTNYKKEVRAKRKMKLQQIKQKIAASKNSEQNVPELLSRAELCVQLAEEKDRTRRKSDDIDVKNPPPSPVTDGHDNSTDGMENINKESDSNCENHRNIINYDEDCLDVGVDMDLF